MSLISVSGTTMLVKRSISLASLVGYVPANFNMAPWPGAFAQASDFSGNVQAIGQYNWVNSTVSKNVSLLDGTSNGQKLKEDSSNNQHYVVSRDTGTNKQATCTYRMACIAQAAERTRIVVSLTRYSDETNGTVSVGFDLSGGNVGYDLVNGSEFTITNYSMSALGSGWWLCIFDATFNSGVPGTTASANWLQQINLDAGSGTAARNISYQGNGSSGINLWWLNQLPRAVWDMNNRVFHDDFTDLSTIDVNNTLAPGFNWYVNNLAPNSAYPTFSWQHRGAGGNEITLPSSLSISSPSVLKIYNAGAAPQNPWTAMLWSVACPDAGGYIGSVFGAPVIFDGYFAWDVVTSTGLGPAFWGSAIESLINTGLSAANDMLEWDVTDIQGSTSVAHDWYQVAGVVHDNQIGSVDTTSTVEPAISSSKFARITGIWLDSTTNGDNCGRFMHFLNGQFINNSEFVYYPLTDTHGAAIETQHLPVFMDTGVNVTGLAIAIPMYVDWVSVYTP